MAISRIKSAFYIRLAHAYKTKFSQQTVVACALPPLVLAPLTAFVCCALPCPASLDFTDVIESGFAFRVRIYYEKELALRRAADKEAKLAGRPTCA